ncbi:MAG: dihydrolipoyl dehydrogenase [Eubacteriales bacterium]|nr:dihydrolipoyl dehydrogenase [Eubacteriales bacterium]
MFDLIVLGGGPGGYLAAERAQSAGKKVCLIEKRAVGGVCLNEGCIPSKSFLNSGKLYEHALDSKAFGVTTENAQIDQKAVVKRKNRVVKRLVGGVKVMLRDLGVEVINAEGKVSGKRDGKFVVTADGTEYTAENLILAMGSEAIVIPLPGVEEGIASGQIMTNREILDLNEIPEHLVIVGGGVIGLEMAAYFAGVGAKVTVIEMLDHIAGNTDRELTKILQENLEKKGIVFELEAKVTAFAEGKVFYEKDGEAIELDCDKVLLSIGRRAQGLNNGLESIGVELDRSVVKIDKHCRTNVENCWAIGDLSGGIMLAHTAYREAEVAVHDMLGIEDEIKYNAVPSVIYTQPELASVGESSESARAKGLDFKEVVLPMNFSGRYMAENERGDGICKLLISTDKKTLIGAHIIGSYASEIIFSAGLMIALELDLETMRRQIFPHPSVVEIIREALFAVDL